jgi:uncharacterized protein (DUF924 family)
MVPALATEIIGFWQTAGPERWYAKDPAFDRAIAERFETAHHAAARGEHAAWAASWQGTLALLLLLDQFPRNIWRGSAHAFATDPLARNLAREALAAGFDKLAPTDLRMFFYLPFEHSELIADQDLCLGLCEAFETEGGQSAEWARMHRDIVLRFGRFPHRNAALGRESSAEELAFLEGGGFSG